MRVATILSVLFVGVLFAAPALADEVPPPPPPPGQPAGAPIYPSEPLPAVVVEEPRTTYAAPTMPVMAAVPRADCVTCGVTCFQRRDACGWPVDCNGCRYGRFELVFEGTYAWLPSPNGRLGDLAIGALAPQFDWEELDYEGVFGGRGAIRYAVAPQTWLEVRGAYYGKWDDTRSRVGTFGFRPGLGGPGNPVTSNPVGGVLDSEAVAWGVELNYQGELSCSKCVRTDLILGARYFSFEEESRVGFANPPIGNFTAPAFVLGEGETQFVGLQIGGVAHWDLAQTFELYGLAKFFGGWARHEVEVADRSIFAGGPHSATDDEDDMQWGGEVELGFRWRLARWLSFQAGYNVFALAGVQRGYDAMDFSQSTSGAVQARIATDEILIHSVFAGFTLSL